MCVVSRRASLLLTFRESRPSRPAFTYAHGCGSLRQVYFSGNCERYTADETGKISENLADPEGNHPKLRIVR